jgi:hypothetical protein
MHTRTVCLGILIGLLTACGGGGSGGGGNINPPDPFTEIEPNNDPGAAMVINVPETVTGSVNLLSDEFDYFVFTLNQAATVTIDLRGADANTDLDLALYDQTVTLIAISASDTQNEQIEKQLDAGVAYYIEVEAFDTLGQSSSYTLDIAVSAATPVTTEVEPNNSFGNAFAVTIPLDLTGSVNDTTDDTDIFILTPNQTATYLIDLQGFAGNTLNLDLAVFDQNQTLINVSASLDQFESITTQLAAGVPYYVLVNAADTSGATFTYDLTIDIAP